MGDVINLRRFKKGRAREEDARRADANRLKFGRTKAQRDQQAALKEVEQKKFDGHKIEE